MVPGYWVIQKYRSGPIGETYKFWMPGTKPDRVTRQMNRDAKKTAQNKQTATRVCGRVLNGSFMEGDVLITLDISEAQMEKMRRMLQPGITPEEERDALLRMGPHERELFIKRLKRAMKKAGLDASALKYWGVTSDQDWDEVQKQYVPARLHHHIIVSMEAMPLVKAAWGGRGGIDIKPLSAQPDYTPIAAYLLGQVRSIHNMDKYTSSRNLQRDFAEPARVAVGPAEIRPPKGAVLLDRGQYSPGMPQYIRYILPGQYDEADAEVGEDGIVRVKAARGHRRTIDKEDARKGGSYSGI